MKHIITVQHTQSVHHTNGMVGSWTDWDLTDLGKIQANNIGKKLNDELKNKESKIKKENKNRSSSESKMNPLKLRNKENFEEKEKANLSIQIRQELHDLSYCGMEDLAGIADFEKDKQIKSTLLRDCMEYTPIRDAVAHTSRLTNLAKMRLNTCFENIKARIKTLLKISSEP